MENQHQKIKGYRDLSKEEIDLMNEIKAKGLELARLVDFLRANASKQLIKANDHGSKTEDWAEHDRLIAAQPDRWIDIAEDHLQQGLMALTRAVAQPTSF